MLQTATRAEICALAGLSSEALGTRATAGWLALAHGVEITANHGQWLADDAIAIELTDELVALGVRREPAPLVEKTSRELAVRFVRECCGPEPIPGWFSALQAAEWGNLAASYVGVGWV